MKIIIVLASVLAVTLAVPADQYSSKLENLDVNEVAGNVALLKNYGKCFVGAGPCTSEGTDIMKIIPEAVQTSCAKCTPKQRSMVRVLIRAFQDKVPEIWEEMSKKYNPTGEYTENLDKFMNSSD